MSTAARTLAAKIWDEHVVEQLSDGQELLYVDLHLTHEATSPQAFDGLRTAGRRVRRPELTLAMEDHNVPTDGLRVADPVSRAQLDALRRNCREFGITNFRLGDPQQGIVHVVGPELGLVQPGMTVVCGDSHTSTHGAFGALAFGIGTSEVEHVLATQTLRLRRPRTLAAEFRGSTPPGVTAKDVMLAFIARIGTDGGRGHIIEYRGECIRDMSMEQRMTLCNLSIEAGARAGLVAPDHTTETYLRGRRYAPDGARLDRALTHWRALATDPDATFDKSVRLDVSRLSPYVTWGTNPSQALPIHERVPDPTSMPTPDARARASHAIEYMGIEPGCRLSDLEVDVVFLGSCTNGRIEDLRAAAEVLRGKQVADGVRMLVVPGSTWVRAQAEEEGLDEVFRTAGALWRAAGCSMCIGMNPDRVSAGERCASTSNRNFEGRQGAGARTHLVSPAVAAATAVAGRFRAPADL